MIEKVHLFGLKRFLGVDTRTPSELVFGEVGRFSIYRNVNVRCMRTLKTFLFRSAEWKIFPRRERHGSLDRLSVPCPAALTKVSPLHT